MGNDIFQSLWLGSRLSMMETLSIESFLKFGYAYHLYCYEAVENVPPGVTVCDAREIVPADQIFYYQHGFGKGSPAGFSDLFRYKLLLEKGQWWVDTDVVCVRPFDLYDTHVIGYERQADRERANNAVLRMPVGSEVARYCYDTCLGIDRQKTRWGETGPELLQRAVTRFGLAGFIQPPDTFYPIDYWRVEKFFEEYQLPSETRAVHLWNAVWRSRGIDPDGLFPPNCLYERLRRQFIASYIPGDLTREQCDKIAAQLAQSNAPRSISRFKKARRWLRARLPWRRAA
jgi:hypothetical protein